MKRFVCLALVFIILFSGCSKWKVEIVDPTKPSESETEVPSEQEEELEISVSSESEQEESYEKDETEENDAVKEYSKEILPFPVIVGHTSDSYFADEYLYFSAPAFSKDTEDYTYDGGVCIYKVDLLNKITEIIKNFGYDEVSILTFAEDSKGNIYYISRECIEPEEKYIYYLCSTETNDDGVIIDVGSAFPVLNGFINDGRGNWCASSFDSVYFLDSSCSLFQKMEFPYDGWIKRLIHIGNDLAVIASVNDNNKIYVLNPERTELSEYASLPENVSVVFEGNDKYDFLYLTYDETFSGSLYGWKNGEAECLISYEEYGIEDIGTLNVHVDSQDNIFIVKNGDYYGKTPVSDILIFKK